MVMLDYIWQPFSIKLLIFWSLTDMLICTPGGEKYKSNQFILTVFRQLKVKSLITWGTKNVSTVSEDFPISRLGQMNSS